MAEASTKTRREPTANLMIRSTKSWHDWLTKFAESQNLNRQVAVDHALRMHARARGFQEPPPRTNDRFEG
jgi:hypothetical protein